MAESGVEAAIRELEREQKKIREVLAILKRIRPGDSNPSRPGGRRRLSAQARRKISVAAKKRWAARQAASAKSRK